MAESNAKVSAGIGGTKVSDKSKVIETSKLTDDDLKNIESEVSAAYKNPKFQKELEKLMTRYGIHKDKLLSTGVAGLGALSMGLLDNKASNANTKKDKK
jgi:hypothetical protein